ncbi:MAG: hypothetical protein A3E87_06735 [Gammaproteobacteria bacterium RIFCSPHIGHO2_12_FULL_35_23]|nr:MAG: hypothetical protein A3E87_06735 [Gammaproteobacteria bacterium RIFCSPHIGHO2_12_FULL_35_23]
MSSQDKKNLCLIGALVVLALGSLAISISFGSIPLSEKIVLNVFRHHSNSINQEIILYLRLPRSLNAFITGGLLALAGTLLQTLLRNPLADPYILGVSGGSAVASLLAILLGITSIGLSSITFAGGLLAMLIIFSLNYRASHWNSSHLLLTGVMFAAGCGAAITLILTLSPDNILRSMMFWLIGEIYTGPVSKLGVVVLVISLIVCLGLARPLNLLSFGELKARSLGVNTKQLTIFLFVLTALLTATAVSIAGPIGFIGLITPHILRLLGCYKHQFLLIGCVLLGGSLLCLADTLARTLVAPVQLPVGAITALIGVPIFLVLLKTQANYVRH